MRTRFLIIEKFPVAVMGGNNVLIRVEDKNGRGNGPSQMYRYNCPESSIPRLREQLIRRFHIDPKNVLEMTLEKPTSSSSDKGSPETNQPGGEVLGGEAIGPAT